jgi:hypothetical protein
MNQNVTDPTVVATEVDGTKRMGFIAQLFGNYYVQGECQVFDWMQRLAGKQYSGGLWGFYELSNGGRFMAPRIADDGATVEIESPNGTTVQASNEATGIIATMFALSHLAFYVAERGGDTDHITNQYWLLRAYAVDHSEAPAIIAAVD